MDLTAVAAFWAVALLLIVSPGPDWAFTLGAALRGHAVASAVGGLATGYALMTLVVAAGVGTLVAASPVALALVTLVGGGYLVWLGASTVWRPAPDVAAAGPVRGDRGTFLAGIGVSGLNPKGLLIFVALLPQFTSRGAPWPVPVQMAVLGLAFTLTCATFYSILGALARRVLRTRPAAARRRAGSRGSA